MQNTSLLKAHEKINLFLSNQESASQKKNVSEVKWAMIIFERKNVYNTQILKTKNESVE